MRKFLLTCGLLAASFLGLNAQIIKSGNITSSETWTSNNIYILNGWVYVKAGATLTIQAGTVIKGDFASQGALIIERDAKIIADGTADMPIVFTSQKSPGQRSYGDWGGLILCGRGSVNQPANASLGTQAGEAVIEGGVGSVYGGGATPNDDDSSGVLRYVRIEFPGIAFQPNSEINGLTCGGVGRKTVIEHVQVSYSGDDSFEFFGGAVNCKWLIAYKGWDDDFDTDFGYHGKIQFAVALRDPNIADQSGSNGFESDNDATGTGNTPITTPIFSNVSIFGPYCFNSTISSNYKRALHLRRNTRCSAFNCVYAGYPTGLLIESSGTQSNATNGDLRFKNSCLVQMNDTLAATTAANPNETNGSFNIYSFFNTAGFSNQVINSASSLQVTNLSLNTPELPLQAGSPLLTGASFSDGYLNDPFFTPVNYIGAFGTGDWTDCWAEWDCQNQPYNAAINNAFSVAVTASGSTSFCLGDSVTLDAGAFSGASYYWMPGGETTQTINVTSGGTYSVTVTKASGCVATSAPVTVTVNPNPAAPVITASGSTSFCSGDSVLLTSSQASGNSWNPGNQTTQSITVTSSGVYEVTYTDANGCSATSAPTTVSVSSAPAPTVSISGSTTLCPGDSVTLTASAADTYLWTPGGQITQSITVTAAGSYFVTVSNTNACNGTGSSASTVVTTTSGPTAGFTYNVPALNQYQFTSTSGGATIYNWDFGDLNQSSAQNPMHIYTTSGTYTVTLTVTSANGCTSTTSQVVNVGVGVEEQAGILGGITLFPNPANDNLDVEVNLNDHSDVQVTVFDLSGKVLVNETRHFSSGRNVLRYDVTGWSNGIYFVRITAGSSVSTVKEVIAR